MRLLLERGADPEVSDGVGLLIHHASFSGRAEAVGLLLRHNADVNAISPITKWTPLHWASKRGHAGVAQILLEHGAY